MCRINTIVERDLKEGEAVTNGRKKFEKRKLPELKLFCYWILHKGDIKRVRSVIDIVEIEDQAMIELWMRG